VRSLTGKSILSQVYFQAWATESMLFRSNFFPISGGSWARKVHLESILFGKVDLLVRQRMQEKVHFSEETLKARVAIP